MPSWAKLNNQVSSFHDVMSEQLADQLYEEGLQNQRLKYEDVIDGSVEPSTSLRDTEGFGGLSCGPDDQPGDSPLVGETEPSTTESDFLLALFLQREMDREYNDFISQQERQSAGNSKVSVSLEKYRYGDAFDDDASLTDDESDEDDILDWQENPIDTSDTTGAAKVRPSPKGHHRGGKDEPTKHDGEICGRRNVARLMDFPPEFSAGSSQDLGDIRLSNVVYNRLKSHSQTEFKRANRLHEKKEYSTSDHAVDSRTRLILFKMVNGGILDSVNGIMAVGKESVVIHANGGTSGDERLPADCVVKIYKTTLTEFKNRSVYVRGDHRFSRDQYNHLNPRRLLKLWAAKEKANLQRLEKNGVPCPRVILLNKHVLVMSLIGSRGQPAPQLKEVALTMAEAQSAYDQTIEIMKKIQRECGLVHADLSQYNLLWCGERVHVIDVGQSVELTHPLAMDFLYRDCRNITHFFKSLGVHGVESPEDLFREVTGLTFVGEGSTFLSHVRQFEKDQKRFADLPEGCHDLHYQFDHFFQLTSPPSSNQTVPLQSADVTA